MSKLSRTARRLMRRAKGAEVIEIDIKSMQRTLPKVINKSLSRSPAMQLFLLPKGSSRVNYILRRLREVVRKSVMLNLSGEPENSYAPLSRAYSRWKQKHFPGRPILQLTQQSLKRFRIFATLERKESLRSGRSMLVVNFTTKMPFYMKFHTTGTKKMPKRDWRKLHKWVRSEIDKILGLK